MSYKTVLVHVDESEHASERIKLAAAVAMAEKAHLVGIATTGTSRHIKRTPKLAELDPDFISHLDFLKRRAERGLNDFESTARKLGMDSFEKQLVDDEAGGGVCLEGRYCDLIVIGQVDPQEVTPVVMQDFPQYVVLHCGRPVLIVPCAGSFDHVGNRVLVAWDASMAATRAVTNALPILKRAQAVDVVVFNANDLPSDPQDPQDPEPELGARAARWLERHGVRATVLQRSAADVGNALLSLATELNSDLLVMGGYGHPRFREILLGGVTRTVLESMSLPILMSH